MHVKVIARQSSGIFGDTVYNKVRYIESNKDFLELKKA